MDRAVSTGRLVRSEPATFQALKRVLREGLALLAESFVPMGVATVTMDHCLKRDPLSLQTRAVEPWFLIGTDHGI